MLTPELPSLKTACIIAENITHEKCRGEEAALFHSIGDRKGLDIPQGPRPKPVYHHGTAALLENTLLEHPNLAMIFHRPSLQTVSNALVRSKKGEKNASVLFLTLLLHLSGSKHHVDSPTLFPEATNGRSSSSRCTEKRLNSIARILEAINSIEMPR